MALVKGIRRYWIYVVGSSMWIRGKTGFGLPVWCPASRRPHLSSSIVRSARSSFLSWPKIFSAALGKIGRRRMAR